MNRPSILDSEECVEIKRAIAGMAEGLRALGLKPCNNCGAWAEAPTLFDRDGCEICISCFASYVGSMAGYPIPETWHRPETADKVVRHWLNYRHRMVKDTDLCFGDAWEVAFGDLIAHWPEPLKRAYARLTK